MNTTTSTHPGKSSTGSARAEMQAHVQKMGEARNRIIAGEGTEDDWELAGPSIEREATEPTLEAQARDVTLQRKLHTAKQQVTLIERVLERNRQEAGIEWGATPTAEPHVGSLTVFDLPMGPPPEPVIDGTFCLPDEISLFYARPGTGKGFVLSWIILKALADGHNVMLFDAEYHRREYRQRLTNMLTNMGVTEDDLKRIQYRSQDCDDWTLDAETFTDAADLIRADCDKHESTFLVIDSLSYASNNSSEMGGQEGARKFISAVKRVGRTAAVAAHTPGNSPRFPLKPFGSIFSGAGAREMWAIEQIESDDIEFDHDTHPLQPTVLALEMRNTKMSEGAKPAPQFITFSFFPADNHIEVTRPEHQKTDLLSLIKGALGSDSLTTKDIAKAIKSDNDVVVKEASVRRVIERNPGHFEETKSSRPKKWRTK